jgi:PKD repeat protein
MDTLDARNWRQVWRTETILNNRAMKTKTVRRKTHWRGWRKSLPRWLVVALCPLIAAWAPIQMLFAETGLRPAWTPPLLDRQFRLQLQGQSNQVYEIQVSTNLQDWTAIAAIPASSNGLVRFADPQAGQFQQRFYRAVARNDLTGAGGDGFRMDRILVKPKPGVNLSSLNLTLGVSVLSVYPAMGNWQVVKTPGHLTPSTLIQSYLASGQVQYAERDYYVEALKDPNDPHYVNGDLWSLKNTGQNNGTPGADIHASAAWDIITSASSVIVALPDTGVRYTHEDLAANMWVNPADGSHGTNTVAGNTDPNDDYGHGTHVSGIIGAVGNNGKGIVGICWRVQIMALKFLDSTGYGTTSDAMACMDYARIHGAKVVNASWGTSSFTSQALHDSIAALRDADIIFVAAAGNSSANNDTAPLYPASYRDLDNVVAVAATDRNDQLADFSDYGPNTVDLGAPGGSPILSCWNGSDSDYQDDDGTSMAAAHVTGAVALLRAYFPSDNHRQIIQRMLSNTDPLPSLARKTISGGRLNLARALGVAPPPPTLTAGFTENPASGPAPLAVQFTNTSTGNPTSWSWSFGDGSSSAAQNPAHTYNAAGNFTATLTVSGSAGQTSSASQTIAVTNATSSGQPVITLTAPQPDAYFSGQVPGTIRFHRTGDLSQSYQVNWTFSGTASNGVDYGPLPANSPFPAGQADADLTITPIDHGQTGDRTVMVTLASGADYQAGTPDSATVTIHGTPAGPTASFTANPTSGQTPLTVQFTDQSSGPVTTWNWNFGDGSASSAQNPSHTYNNAGSFTVTLTVTGSGGQSSSVSHTITVTNSPQPVSAGFSANPTSGQAPLAVQFTDQSTGPVVSWRWNFGDGASSSTQNPSHTYNNTGSFTVTLTVSGGSGQSGSVSHTITVTSAPQPVNAVFSANPTSGQAPLGVQFTDQSSGPVVSWRWNFGDGASSSTQNPSHSYNAAGTFTVTLTVANSAGQISSASHTITVTSAPQPVSAHFAANPTSGQAPLGAQFTDQSSGPVVSWNWNFGDGSSGTDQNPYHTYSNAGTFTATLTVTGSNGQTSSVSHTITVTSAPSGSGRPTITVVATAPNASESGAPGTFTIYRNDGDTSSALTVIYTLGGNAHNGVDYQTLPGTVTFPAGASSVDVVVQPTGHPEPNDQPVIIMLYGYTGAPYIVGKPDSATVTIAYNDQPPARPTVTVAATDPNASASGDPGVFTITRNGGDNSSAVTIKYTLGGNARNGVDYETLPGTATIPAGASSVDVVVQPTGHPEPNDQPVIIMLYGYTAAPYIVNKPDSATVTIANP